MARIYMECIFDESLESFIEEESKATGLTLTFDLWLQSGWPLVKFEGPRDLIVAYLRRYTDNEEETFQELCTRMID